MENITQWIGINKDWLFSGAGITALAIIWFLSKELYKLSWKYRRVGFFIPHSLSYFRHSELNNNCVNLKAKRIVSIHAVANKSITIQYPVNTVGKLNSAISVSDPGTMQVLEPGQNSGMNSIKIKAQKGAQYIVASESDRTVSPFETNRKPQKENLVISTLIKTRVSSAAHDFVGSRVIGRTNTQRIVVEFSENYKPNHLNVVQISEDGSILRDEKSNDFIKANHKNGSLFVVELHSPEENSGLYVWWEWPEI